MASTFLERSRRSLWCPRAADKVPTKSSAQKLRRELAEGRSVSGVLLSLEGYRTRLPQLKAYHDAAAERYKADLKAQIVAAERAFKTLLRATFRQDADAEMEAMATSDPVFRAIRNKPATDWLESRVSNWLSRRGDARVSRA